jgi:hypothetical protein
MRLRASASFSPVTATLMNAMNRYTITYARALVAATPEVMLVDPKRPIRGLSQDQIVLMENEAASLAASVRFCEGGRSGLIYQAQIVAS